MKELNTRIVLFHLTSAIESIELMLNNIKLKKLNEGEMYVHIRHACWHLFHAYTDRFITDEQFSKQDQDDFINNGQIPDDFQKEKFM